MSDDFAALREPAKQRHDKAAERIHFLILVSGLEVDPGLLAKIIQIEPRIRFPSAVGKRAQLRRLRHVVFVVDVAHDLFHEILYRHESIGTAIFVDHQRQMHVTCLHLEQEVQRRHRGGHE